MTERIDDLHRNGYVLVQDPSCFCFGCDAVLLSAFARVKAGGSCLDLCAASGVIPILMEAKTAAARFVGIEIQPRLAQLGIKSVSLNHLEHKIEILQGDIREIQNIIKPRSFDTVTVNPPYTPFRGGIKNHASPVAIARHEICAALRDVIFAANYALKDGGKLYMIHKPSRLPEIFCEMRGFSLEPKEMRLVQPFFGKAPEMALIGAVKGGGAQLNVYPPLIIYDEVGKYTDEVYDMYYN
ncbi:hypothetical protein AGMMS49975_14480 [Clostridia bacterium]|nr:hypothetical protein AGMMS49975_14480 [Clostridia bacterium]